MAKQDPSDKKKCFVIGPIGSNDSPERQKADMLLNLIIKEVLENAPFSYEVKRADEGPVGMITPQLINDIINADLILADLSDQNANVFFELAIAFMEEKKR